MRLRIVFATALTLLRNHAPHIAAMDLFKVPTIGFIQLYVLAICRLAPRRLLSSRSQSVFYTAKPRTDIGQHLMSRPRGCLWHAANVEEEPYYKALIEDFTLRSQTMLFLNIGSERFRSRTMDLQAALQLSVVHVSGKQ
jgi:hypothetical protein